jgi:hypothetical protein
MQQFRTACENLLVNVVQKSEEDLWIPVTQPKTSQSAEYVLVIGIERISTAEKRGGGYSITSVTL